MKSIASLLFLVLASSAFAQKKTKPEPEPPKTYPTARVFAATCDTVWPIAVQVFMTEGWSVKTSDRAGGILTLDWAKGEWHGTKSAINPLVAQFTLEKSTGLYTIYNGFRIASGMAVAAQLEAGCTYSIQIIYHGQGGGFGAGDAWRILRSNGFRENQILEGIAAKLPK